MEKTDNFVPKYNQKQEEKNDNSSKKKRNFPRIKWWQNSKCFSNNVCTFASQAPKHLQICLQMFYAAFTLGQLGSIPFGSRSTLARIRLNCVGLRRCGTALKQYNSKLDHLHKRTHLVLDRRTDLEWIYHIKARLILTNSLPVPNGSDLV